MEVSRPAASAARTAIWGSRKWCGLSTSIPTCCRDCPNRGGSRTPGSSRNSPGWWIFFLAAGRSLVSEAGCDPRQRCSEIGDVSEPNRRDCQETFGRPYGLRCRAASIPRTEVPGYIRVVPAAHVTDLMFHASGVTRPAGLEWEHAFRIGTRGTVLSTTEVQPTPEEQQSQSQSEQSSVPQLPH